MLWIRHQDQVFSADHTCRIVRQDTVLDLAVCLVKQVVTVNPAVTSDTTRARSSRVPPSVLVAIFILIFRVFAAGVSVLLRDLNVFSTVLKTGASLSGLSFLGDARNYIS